jgi:hypothetical protein
MPKHVLIVLSNCFEGTDDTFNTWYTNTHLADVIGVPGFSAAQRYRLSSSQLGEGPLPYQYLAVYEVDADDVNVPRDGLTNAAANGVSMYIDPSIDRDRTVAWFYTPITERVTGEPEKELVAPQAGA